MRPHTTEMRDLTAACALRLEVQQPNHGTVATPLVVSLRHISDTAHKDSRSLHSRVYPLSLHHAAFTADRQDAETLTLRCGDSSRRCQQAVSAATSQCNRCIHQRSSSATTTASAETATGNHTSNCTNRLHDHVSPRATATMTRIIASTEPAITTTPTTTTRPRAMSQQRSCGRDLSPTLQRPPPPPQPVNIKPLQTTIPNYGRHRP